MRPSMISAALVAALVGYGSTIALVLAAAQAVSATPVQTASWVAAICFAKAIGSAVLSATTRVPIVLAWSTPGAALIAGSSGIEMSEAVGAFVLAGGLIALTGAVPILNRAVAAIPAGIASGMLAGVLLPFCVALALSAKSDWALVLPLVVVYLVVRMASPLYAVLAALVVAAGLVAPQVGPAIDASTFDPFPLTPVVPVFDPAVLFGLGVPLYLVTMASQNLPGFAVLRANGYEPPVRTALGVSGGLSAIFALFGSHTINMAAITAAICLGDDVHPDRDRRWRVGLAYAAVWLLLGIFGSMVVAAVLAMPKAIVAAVAGLALLAPLTGALAAAFDAPQTRFAAATTLVVTASGVSAFGIGAAFWGLAAGLAVHAIDRLAARWKRN